MSSPHATWEALNHIAEPFVALTAKDVPIRAKALHSKDAVALWLEAEGERYGAVKVKQRTASGWRTIWRQTEADRRAA